MTGQRTNQETAKATKTGKYERSHDVGGTLGAIPSKSLEELNPQLTFEGARFTGMVRDMVDVVLFYARPKHRPGTRKYRQHLPGAETKHVGYHEPSASSLTLQPIEHLRRGQPPAHENDVFNIDSNAALAGGFLLEGEWSHSETRVDSVVGCSEWHDGCGLFFGFKSRYPECLGFCCSCLRPDGEFEMLPRTTISIRCPITMWGEFYPVQSELLTEPG